MVPLFKVHVDVDAALTRLQKVLQSGYIGEGPVCKQFEAELAIVLNFPRPLLTNSGTSALRLALHLAGARPGAEVISTPQTCLATNTAILETGAKIVWADIDPNTGNIDPYDAVQRVTSKTVAVMAVDWGGRLCDFATLRSLLRGVTIIEDAAHAMGATRHVGEHGDYVCYSLQAIKHLTTGDGGILVCPGDALTERARLLRWFGLDRTRGDSMRCYQQVHEAGFKMQSNDIAASIGLANLATLKDRVKRCRDNAAFYSKRLSGAKHLELPPPDPYSAWWIYTVRVSNPIMFEKFCADRGVAVGQVHARNDTNPCFDVSRPPDGELVGVEDFAAHQTNLPCAWHVSDEDREKVAQVVEEWDRTKEARW